MVSMFIPITISTSFIFFCNHFYLSDLFPLIGLFGYRQLHVLLTFFYAGSFQQIRPYSAPFPCSYLSVFPDSRLFPWILSEIRCFCFEYFGIFFSHLIFSPFLFATFCCL